MTLQQRTRAAIACSVLTLTAGLAWGQSPAAPASAPASTHATITLHVDAVANGGTVISKYLYGQFAEHLGGCIYGGIWVGKDSPIPNVRGIRTDVVDALKELQVPDVRWPGGCFADEYHWRDGIGPPDQRPHRINSHWGGVVETNAFGTHEFMDFCQQVGTQPYISLNVGTGSPQEAKDWIEYMTSNSDSALANERRKNGREEPWKIPFVGVGNESWGCGGNMRPEYYADQFRRFNTFIENQSGNRISRIACGSNGADFNWTDVVMNIAGNSGMNGISLHWYSLPTGNWSRKGSAIDFGEDQWASLLSQADRMQDLIARHSAIMDKYDPQKRVGLVVDEWGAWYDVQPGTNPGFLYQQNTMRDAVLAGLTLNIFQQHADRVKMADIAQMVNVLQAMILTKDAKMVRTPTYWVFDMYKPHRDATLVPVDVQAPDYRQSRYDLPGLSVSASKDAAGKVHVSIVNLNPRQGSDIAMKVAGMGVKGVTGQILTATTMNARNTFDNPDAVKPAAFSGASLEGGNVRVMMPPMSVVMLELD